MKNEVQRIYLGVALVFLIVLPISAFADKSSKDGKFQIYFESEYGIQENLKYFYGPDSSVLEIEGHLFGWQYDKLASYTLLLIFVFPKMTTPDSLEMNVDRIKVWIDGKELDLYKTTGFHKDSVDGGYNVLTSFVTHSYELSGKKKLIRKYPKMENPFIKVVMNDALIYSKNSIARDTLFAYPQKTKKSN